MITRARLIVLLLLLVPILFAGCAGWPEHSDWQWHQDNPEWKPLPGDAH